MTQLFPTPENPLRATAQLHLIRNAYVALAVAPMLADFLSSRLQPVLGDSYEELKTNRDLRDGESNYHMTAIRPQEFRALSKSLKSSGSELQLPKENFDFEILGFGTAASEDRQAWFALCRSEAVADWRASLELPPHDLHITLAFGALGDVHGVSKGLDTLISSHLS